MTQMSKMSTDEARYILAQDRLKQLVDGSDEDYIKIVIGIVSSGGVSDEMRSAYPSVFADETNAGRIAKAVLSAFVGNQAGQADGNDADVTPNFSVRPRAR